MKKPKIVCLTFLLVTLLFPFIVNAEEDMRICVEARLYEVTAKGDSVDIFQINNKDELRRKSLLPRKYFEMKTYLEKPENQDLKVYLENLADRTNFATGSGVPDLIQMQMFALRYGDVYQQYGFGSDVEKNYAFNTTYLGKRCTRTEHGGGGYGWRSCPTTELEEIYSTEQIKKAILHDGIVWDSAASSYYIEFADKFNGNVIIRQVASPATRNINGYDYESIYRQYPREFRNLTGTQKFYVGIAPQNGTKEVYLEFYLKTDADRECGGAYLGQTIATVPNYADVANPWYNTQMCRDFRNGYNYIPTTGINYKEIMVPECMNPKIDYYELRTVTESAIRNKIQQAINLFKPIENAIDIEKDLLKCSYIRDDVNNVNIATKKFVMTLGGGASSSHVWEALCTETIEVRYDPPKAVNAGGGFTYNTTVTVKRECTPYSIKAIEKLPQCIYNVECWYGPANHTGESGAGPNEEMDACVKTCDGGKYTQECINSCYKKVYENEEVKQAYYGRNFSDVLIEKQYSIDVSNKEIKVTPLAAGDENDPASCKKRLKNSPNYCYVQNPSWNWDTSKNRAKTDLGTIIFDLAAKSNGQSNCNGSTYCTTLHGKQFTYLNGCNSEDNPTLCYEVYSSKPRPYCSDNPDLDYKAGLDTATKEYNELMAKIKAYEEGENFEIDITDSYLTDSKGNLLVTNFKSLEDMVKVTGGVQKYSDGKTYKVIRTSKDNISGRNVETIQVQKEYQIDLPQAVLNQLTGQVEYKKNDYQPKLDELAGGNKYYTDINSKTTNDWRYWHNGKWIETNYKPDKWNIHVTFKNIGTKQTSGTNAYTWDAINLDCFYGLINQYIIPPDPDNPDNPKPTPPGGCGPDDPNCELICEDGDVCTTGLQYMFREVNLNDLFPGRDPRWNWTYNATVSDNYGYYSNPQKVIEDVEKLGNNAYKQDHMEYEINLTKANIRAIEKENRRLGNYLNYDLGSCTLIGGRKVCESNLLKNTNFVASYIKYREYGTAK